MKASGLFVAGVATLLLAAGCSSATQQNGPTNGASAPTAPSQQESATLGNVKVDGVRAYIKDGQVQVFVRGEIGDGCTRLQPMAQTRSGNTINVNVSSIRQGEVCTMIMQLLNGWVPLSGTLEPGTYTVRANAATATFTLTRDSGGQLTISPDPGPLPDGPTYP
jgi:outer membrane biogenesis lipoprotein LolB